jgi:hypothetical protein
LRLSVRSCGRWGSAWASALPPSAPKRLFLHAEWPRRAASRTRRDRTGDGKRSRVAQGSDGADAFGGKARGDRRA